MLAQVAVLTSSRGASLAVFPTISRLVSDGQRDRLPAVIDLGLRLILTAVVPAAVLILFLGEDIVVVVLQRGAFLPADARMTALALAAYSGSIVALSLGNVLSYVYYALQDTKTPAIVGSVGMGLNLALALSLREWVGFLAPAVSFSIMAIFNLVVLVVILHQRLGRLIMPGFFAFGAKIGLAGLAMAGAILLTRQSLNLMPAVSRWPPLLQLAYHGLSGLLVYLLGWSVVNRALLGRALRQLGTTA
jgi:putative peptidoglycan lipid II flippase